MKGRLNLFQSAMLRWRELYPYNAVHAITIDGTLDRPRLARAIDRLLESLGLTGLELDHAGRRFAYRGGPNGSALEFLDGGREPRAALEREMERQLNLPFAREGRVEPFRFFAVDAGERFHLGLAYDHFLAAGDSIATLLAHLARRYLAVDADGAADDNPACGIRRPSVASFAASFCRWCAGCGESPPSRRAAGAACGPAIQADPIPTTR